MCVCVCVCMYVYIYIYIYIYISRDSKTVSILSWSHVDLKRSFWELWWQKYKVLAWNSKWRSPIDLSQSWLILSCSQWARCSTFKYLANVCSSSLRRIPETLHLPPLHLYRSADQVCYGVYSCYMCSSSRTAQLIEIQFRFRTLTIMKIQ